MQYIIFFTLTPNKTLKKNTNLTVLSWGSKIINIKKQKKRSNPTGCVPHSLKCSMKTIHNLTISLWTDSATDSPPSQSPLVGRGGTLAAAKHQDPTEQTHIYRQTHDSMKEWMEAREMREWDTLTLPLILLRCVGPCQSECLPSTHCGSFQSAFNPIMKLVTLPWSYVAHSLVNVLMLVWPSVITCAVYSRFANISNPAFWSEYTQI